MPYDVFLSHSSKDKVIADAICAKLEAEKIRCWMAPRDILPGEEWAEAILRGLDSCRVMILVFSASANSSAQVKREVEHAFNNELVVVPFRIEDVQPTRSLKFYLSSVHWLDALTEPLERHIAKLVPRVKGIVETGDAPAAPAVPLPPRQQPKQEVDQIVLPPKPTVAPMIKLPSLPSASPSTPNLVRPAPTVIQKPSPVAGGPWTNSLGMVFVPVPGVKVWFGIWAVRVRDYRAYAEANTGVDGQWKNPGFPQDDTHPVVKVSWEDAQAFCAWLSRKEGKTYRLPTDAEWSVAVGLGGEKGNTPAEKSMKIKDVYPWGNQWPPPKGAGNYSSSLQVDDFDYTSPVGSFSANRHGLYDMGGNVWEWCDDFYDGKSGARVLRGASWVDIDPDCLLSSYRYGISPDYRSLSFGFRVVLGVVGSSP